MAGVPVPATVALLVMLGFGCAPSRELKPSPLRSLARPEWCWRANTPGAHIVDPAADGLCLAADSEEAGGEDALVRVRSIGPCPLSTLRLRVGKVVYPLDGEPRVVRISKAHLAEGVVWLSADDRCGHSASTGYSTFD